MTSRPSFDDYRRLADMDREEFHRVLRSLPPGNDEDAALLIDARSRHAGSVETLDLDLNPYFQAVPHLRSRPIVLDAAIDAVIRARVRSGRTAQSAIAELRSRYPELSESIEAAAMLAILVGTGSTTQASMSDRVLPEEIGPPTPEGNARYVLREKIGSGSSGTLYLAVDRLLSNDARPFFVAIKFFHHLPATILVQRIALDESLKARRISHPNVTQSLDRGRAPDGSHYVVFEYVEGGNLDAFISSLSGRMTPRCAAALVRDIARGTQAIHSAGLIHCDLKPANVLLTRDRLPKVTDFGLAQWSATDPLSHRQNELGGTLGFGAPEQFIPGEVFDAATDTYALGAMLAWCLTLQVPNGPTPQLAKGNLTNYSASGPVNPDAVRSIPHFALARICARAMDRDRSKRYRSAEALANDLERVLNHEDLPWAPGSVRQRVARLVLRERLAVIFALVLSLIIVGGAVVVTIEQQAAARAVEASIRATERESIERERTELLRADANALFQGIRDLKNSGIGTDWLFATMLIESLTGVFFDPATLQGRENWNDRINVALTQARMHSDEHGSTSIIALEWELLAGFWQLRANRFEEGVATLARNTALWEQLGIPGEPLADLARKLWAAGIVLGSASQSASITSADLNRARAELESPDSTATQFAGGAVMSMIEQARASSGTDR